MLSAIEYPIYGWQEAIVPAMLGGFMDDSRTVVEIPVEEVEPGDFVEVEVPSWRLHGPSTEGSHLAFGRAGPIRQMASRMIGIQLYFNPSYTYAGRWTPGSTVRVIKKTGGEG